MKQTLRYVFLSLFFCAASTAYSQWVKTDGFEGMPVTAILAAGTDLVAGTQYNGVYRSTNNGTNWFAANTGLPESTVVYCFSLSGSNLFAGKGKQIFRSTNNGGSWSGVNTGLDHVQQIYSIVSHGSFLFAGTTNGLFRSTNNGASWDSVISDLPSNSHITCFASSGAALLAGTSGGSIFRTINNGTNWVPANTGLSAMSIYAFIASGGKIFAGTQDGIFVTTNTGSSWIPMNAGLAGNPVTRSFALSGTDIFTAAGGQVFLSKDGSSQWMQVHTGLLVQNVIALEKNGEFLFAANFSGGIWRRPISEMITSVMDRSVVPAQLYLEQNFPNPFNPSTTIGFTLETSGSTTLTIFDAMGREAAVLVSDDLEAGIHHQRQFDASTLSSGIYFARLVGGGKIQIRKMMLMK